MERAFRQIDHITHAAFKDRVRQALILGIDNPRYASRVRAYSSVAHSIDATIRNVEANWHYERTVRSHPGRRHSLTVLAEVRLILRWLRRTAMQHETVIVNRKLPVDGQRLSG
jgi:hypothetical protein